MTPAATLPNGLRTEASWGRFLFKAGREANNPSDPAENGIFEVLVTWSSMDDKTPFL
jgi:hypothetical protein